MKLSFMSCQLVLVVLVCICMGALTGSPDGVETTDDASDVVISALDYLADATPEQLPDKEVTDTIVDASVDDVTDVTTMNEEVPDITDSSSDNGNPTESDLTVSGKVTELPGRAIVNSEPPVVVDENTTSVLADPFEVHDTDNVEETAVSDPPMENDNHDPLVVHDDDDDDDDDDDLVKEVRDGKSYDGYVCSVNSTDNGVITMPPPPVNTSCKAYFWTASVDEGFVPDITLEALKLDHKVGEFLLIGPGADQVALWLDETCPMVTASVVTPKRFRVLESNVFSVFLVTNTPTGFKGNFTLRYRPDGEIETTPAPTTPAPTLPAPGPNITAEIIIYLAGTPADEYNTVIEPTNVTLREQLQDVIAHMAYSYSQIPDNEISLSKPITAENVVFSMIRACPSHWVQANTCAQVNVSVAAIIDTPDLYELTAEHLTDMWSKIDKHDPRLVELKLYKYDQPNAATSMFVWLGLSLIVLVVFIFILVVVWRVDIWDYKRMRSKDEMSYSQRNSTTSNDSSWFPAEHQLVPPYMEAFSETGYVEYEPEFDGPVPANKYQTLPSPLAVPATGYNLPPRYGAPNAFGGAIHFYGNNARKHYNNPTFMEEEEDETNMEVNTSGGLTLSHRSHNDNSMC